LILSPKVLASQLDIPEDYIELNIETGPSLSTLLNFPNKDN
jgi:hypothetical protein